MSTIQQFHDILLRLQPLNLLDFQEIIPEFQKLAACKQDPSHHAEGSVLIHANMALAEAFTRLDQVEEPNDKLALYIATMLHDIGKPDTFGISPKHGRITAYGHDKVGVQIANEFLRKYFPEFDYPMRAKILSLIENHMLPRQMIKDGTSDNKLKLLSMGVNTKLLYLLSQSDTLGRKAQDNTSGMDLLEKFKAECERLSIWGQIYNVPGSSGISNAGYSLARWNILTNGKPENFDTINEAEEMMHRMPRFQLLMMVGAPGSGKTTYREKLQIQYPDIKVICMDDKRKELTGNINDQSQNQKVFELCMAEFKNAMRNRKSVIWDATETTRKLRKHLWQIARRNGALCGAVYFDLPLQTLLERNAQREKRVPDDVVIKFYKRLESILPLEADQLIIVDK